MAGGRLYLTVVGLHLASLFAGGWAVAGTKLLIVPVLAWVVWREAERLPRCYAGALVASWVGDLAMWVADDGLVLGAGGWLTAGIGAFGVAHVCYAWLAVRAGGRLPPKLVTTAVATVSVGAAIVLRVPPAMALYAATLALLAYLTLTLARKPTTRGGGIEAGVFGRPGSGADYRYAFAGAVAFAASDALIAWQLAGGWTGVRPWWTVGIMALYAGGQWGLRGLAPVSRR